MSDAETWSDVLNLESMMRTHGREMIRRGGQSGAGKPGCIEGAVGTAWLAEEYGASEMPGAITGLIFACFALRGLAFNHCLQDGNKRLAWIAFVEILGSRHLTIDVGEDEAAEFVNKVVIDHLRGDEIVRWAMARLTILDPASVH